MERCALVGARLVDPDTETPLDQTLLLEDGRIVDRLARDTPLGGGWRRVAMPGRLIAPGFIDVHFHGELFTARPSEFATALAHAAKRMLPSGTTAFLATTVSWASETMGERVAELARVISEDPIPGASCIGLHLEGPWLSRAAPGAMARECIRPFRPAHDGEVLDRAGEWLRMVTLAPEIEGAGALLDELSKRNVVASLGHSHAAPEQIDAGIGRGLRHVTHLFNAMGPFHHRAPAVAGTVLADDRLSCDLICDGHHVHPDMLRIAIRALAERLVLITDRVDLGETPMRAPETGAPVRLADGTIAGSQLGQDQAIRNAMAFAGLTLNQAVAAATIRPARLLGVERERGTLWTGARADLAILDDSGQVIETWIGGRPVFAGKDSPGGPPPTSMENP